jgi:Tol biopolymer transport system component
MAADGSNNRRLTEDKASNYHAKWLPDGSGIIFDSNRDHNPGDEVTNREIYTMNHSCPKQM